MKKIDLINLSIYRIKLIIASTSLNKYQYKTQNNQKLKLAINSRQLNNNKDDNSTINALEKVDLFNTVKINNNNNDNK